MDIYETVKTSYERCVEVEGFFADFYETFLARSTEVSEKFAETDFKTQNNLLKASLYMMVVLRDDDPTAREALERIGETHNRQHHDIRPELYDQWLDCLIETVAKHDPDYTDEVGQAWRQRMGPGIELIRSMY